MPDSAGESTPQGGSFIERARRAQIVEAAIAVIATVGYPKASFARIAEHAGISPGLISYHFDNKDDLVHAVVDLVTGSLDAVLSERMATAGNAGEALRVMIETEVEYFAAHAAQITALGSIRAGARDARTGESVAETQRANSVSQVEEFLRDGQAAGMLRQDFDPRVMAVSLVGALEMVPGELARRPATDPRRYGQELARIFARATDAATGGTDFTAGGEHR